MGNIPGMPNIPDKEIQRVANEIMNTFLKIYTKQYTIGFIKKCKTEAGAGSLDWDSIQRWDFQLQDAPLESNILKEGMATKKGALRKNWKARFMVATNAADNWDVKYYPTEADKGNPKKLKGTIQLCGYKVEKVDGKEAPPADEKKEEETAEAAKEGDADAIPEEPEEETGVDFGPGEFGIKLVPRGRRRTWFLKFETEEERDEWANTLSVGAKKASPPLNKDPVLRSAFMQAYRQTRWELGVWGWYSVDATEEEMMAMMIVDRLNDDIMGPVYREIPSGRMYWKTRKMVQNMLDKIVGGVVGASWKAAMQGLEASRGTLESSVKEKLDPIFTAQGELKGKLQDACNGVCAPIITELVSPLAKPALDYLLEPIYSTYGSVCRTYEAEMTKIIAAGCNDRDIDNFTWRTWYSWGVLEEAYTILRAFTRSDAMEVVSTLCYGVSRWEIEYWFEDRIYWLCKRAGATFKAKLQANREEHGDPKGAEVLAEILPMFRHDAMEAIKLSVRNTFLQVLEPLLQKKIIPALKALVDPIDSAIPDAMKVFLDPNQFVEEIIWDLTIACMNPIIMPSIEGQAAFQ